MELTQAYLDQKFIEERKCTDDKFDELLRTIKTGFDAVAPKEGTATKEDIRQLRAEMATKEELKKGLGDLQFQISQLAQQVKEFVETVKKQDREYVELKVKYHELEQRVLRLEELRAT